MIQFITYDKYKQFADGIDDCDTAYNPVCGTNDATYFNECRLELEAAKTRNKELSVAHYGVCLGRIIYFFLNLQK